NAANHLRGMFVFVIHDTQKDLVLMARDRMGQQPLYYTTTQAGIFVFASEIKSLLQFPAVQVNHGPIGVDAFLTMGFSPGPETLFKGIHKLPPGHRLSWNPGLHIMIEPYWQWEGLIVPPAALKT